MHRIVIIGGGEGSLARSARMGDARGKRGETSITLVDGAKPQFWKPPGWRRGLGRFVKAH